MLKYTLLTSARPLLPLQTLLVVALLPIMNMESKYQTPWWVRQIVDDLEGYATLGAEVSLLQLTQLADISAQLRHHHSQVLASARRSFQDAFQEQIAEAEETLLELRAKSSQSNSAIFSRTILYLLKRGPLPTKELHPLVQKIHPDLCDDRIDRVIQGVRFGKRWKHMVRNAQQSLKEQGLIKFDGRKWNLTTPASSSGQPL